MNAVTYRLNRILICRAAVFCLAGLGMMITGLSAAMAADSSASATPKGAETYTTRPGERLDKVIQKTLGDSPFKLEILRKAFVQANPQAFVAADFRQMRAGTVLQVPDHSQLARGVLEAILQQPETRGVASGGPSGPSEERRTWVRFP